MQTGHSSIFNLNPFKKGIEEGISLFTAVKNRQETLREALKTWVLHDVIDEIIIVDWSSDESLIPMIDEFQNGKIILAIVSNQPKWILSHAFNLAARLTSKSKILKLDADVKILPGFFEQHLLSPGIFFTGNWKTAKDDNEKHLHGISFILRDSFFSVNGFNEFIKSYGWDDIDLYDRLQNKSLLRKYLNHDTLCHIPHENRTSLQNQISFIHNINDTEKSLLNSLVNKFITLTYKPWTIEENQLVYLIETATSTLLNCNQANEDQNIVPPEIMFECERQAIIERFYELGIELSKELLSELNREDLINLLNLFYARQHSQKDSNLFNLFLKFDRIFNLLIRINKVDIHKLKEKLLDNENLLNSQSEIIRYKNHLIEGTDLRLKERTGSLSKSKNQKISHYTSHSWKIGQMLKDIPLKVNLGNQIGAYFGSHRSGWGYAFSALADLHNPKGILLDAFIERTFHWHPDRIQPHLEPWIGFIHVPPFVPNWFANEVSNDSIFSLHEWKESLSFCKGLYTLSHYHKRILQSRLKIPINNLLHPTEEPKVKWEWNKFQKNSEKKVVQVGFWLRKLYSIHLLQADNYQKIFLRKEDVNIDHLLEEEKKYCEFANQITEEIINSVKTMNFLSNQDYDKLLAENIVFLDLYDASANNSIIECIMRNTPILVNPIEAVIEYLGPEYPFYYSNLGEAALKLKDLDLIKRTHHYLMDHPLKRKLTASYFRKSFIKSDIYQKL